MTTLARELTIFVVDDDEAVRDSLEALLEAVGYRVKLHRSCREFLEADDAPQNGCLVVDVRTADLGCLALQRRLAAKGIDFPIIVIAGHADASLAVKAVKCGVDDFIEQPFKDEVVLEIIQSALESGGAPRRKERLAAEVAGRIAKLTPREREVLEQLVIGWPNKVIAVHYGISPRTVEIHRARVMKKMEARSLSHLVRMALAAGIEPTL